MQELTADLKHWMRGVWRDDELVDPNTHKNKLATHHSWFAIPFSRNERMPINVPRYLHLNLSKHVMRNIRRFRLRAHTLKVEAAAWLEDGSCVWCDQCPGEDEHVQNEVHALLFCQDHRVCELRKLFPSCLHLFWRTFEQPNPFCCNRSTTNLFMISFLSRTIYTLFLSIWNYVWLAETPSQQPISQTTWLKVTPHCSHCNHYTPWSRGHNLQSVHHNSSTKLGHLSA